MNEEDIPNSQLFKGSFAHSAKDSDELILDTLASFTRYHVLSTIRWKVMRRMNDGDTAILFLSIDNTSAEYIK